MTRYRHIIWDWNGTLIDDAQACVEVLNEILARRGRGPVSYEQYREDFDFPVKDYYSRIGFDFTVEPYEELAHEYIEAYRKKQFQCRLHAGAEKALRSCLEMGLTQSILSAYQQELLEEITGFFGIKELFVRLVGLDDHYAHSKLDNGRELLAELCLKGPEVLLVGDTLHDRQVAKEIGTDCVLICNGHHPRHRLQKCGVKILESLTQVPIFLKKQC